MSPNNEVDFSLKDRPEFDHKTSSGAAPIKHQAQDFIDEHLFIEALALAAFEVIYREPQPSNIEKVSHPSIFSLSCLTATFFSQIVLLLERMNHSEGPRRIQLAYGVTRFGQGSENGADITSLLR